MKTLTKSVKNEILEMASQRTIKPESIKSKSNLYCLLVIFGLTIITGILYHFNLISLY